MNHWRRPGRLHRPWHEAGTYPVGRRSRFVRRLGFVLILVLSLSAAGAGALMSWTMRQAGAVFPGLFVIPIVGLVPLVALVGMFLFVLTMRRVGLPMGDIVAAADRVAAGDYGTRLDERGPPFLRIVARAFNRMTMTLQAQDRQRRDLLADIAHELRTPLSVMQGRLEGVLDGVYDRSDAQLGEVLDETRMLARLVDDLGTLAHAERGVMGLRKEPTDLAALIADAVGALEPEARTRRVHLSVDAPTDMDLVNLDPLRMREVVLNLAANGIRHSQEGAAVTVSVAQEAGSLTIAVRDTGPGMSAEALSTIFDRFQKGPRSQGSGLGLAITRHLVEAHGGTIHVESTPGVGTTMRVRVPMRKA